MEYEVISDIRNSCSGNQMRDVFYEEIETDDPDVWIRAKEPLADAWRREDLPHGIRYYVEKSGLVTVYTLSEI